MFASKKSLFFRFRFLFRADFVFHSKRRQLTPSKQLKVLQNWDSLTDYVTSKCFVVFFVSIVPCAPLSLSLIDDERRRNLLDCISICMCIKYLWISVWKCWAKRAGKREWMERTTKWVVVVVVAFQHNKVELHIKFTSTNQRNALWYTFVSRHLDFVLCAKDHTHGNL